MQESIEEIRIPKELSGAVEKSLRQVAGIHRGRILKRAGMTVGCFAVLLGALTAFGLANPVLASQIPLIGGFFQQIASHNKISPGNQNVADYKVIQQIGAAETAADHTLTVVEGYSDGNRIQLTFTLEAPGITDEAYNGVSAVEIGKSAFLTVNGIEVPCGLSPLHYVNGKWQGFIEGDLPEELQDAEALETTLALRNLHAQEKPTAGEVYSEENPPRYQALGADLSMDFSVQVDRAHEFAFSYEAEDNGAKVFAVSGTPIQTVISIEKPYWGETTPHVEDSAQGIPQLLTIDGKNVQKLPRETMEQGGYDGFAREAQTADLYFDGLPAGTKQAILRFHKSSFEEAGVLAEFIIDIEAQTVAPSTTYQEGGVLDLDSPYDYVSLQMGDLGELQNGVRVLNVGFDRWSGKYNGSVYLYLEAPMPESGYRVALSYDDGTSIFSVDCVGTEGDNWSQSESVDLEAMGEGEEKKVYDVSVHQELLGIDVPIGQSVVITVTDLATGKVICTDTRSLTVVHRF